MWNETPIEQLLVLLIFASFFIWFFYSEGFFNDIIDSIKGKDSEIETRDYFGFSSILGNDSVRINENTNLDHLGGIVNFYSKWNHLYNSNLSISYYEIRSDYIAEQFSMVNANRNTLIGSIDEKNRFYDRRIKFFNQFMW